jgi:hypothetical protein
MCCWKTFSVIEDKARRWCGTRKCLQLQCISWKGINPKEKNKSPFSNLTKMTEVGSKENCRKTGHSLSL